MSSKWLVSSQGDITDALIVDKVLSKNQKSGKKTYVYNERTWIVEVSGKNKRVTVIPRPKWHCRVDLYYYTIYSQTSAWWTSLALGATKNEAGAWVLNTGDVLTTKHVSEVVVKAGEEEVKQPSVASNPYYHIRTSRRWYGPADRNAPYSRDNVIILNYANSHVFLNDKPSSFEGTNLGNASVTVLGRYWNTTLNNGNGAWVYRTLRSPIDASSVTVRDYSMGGVLVGNSDLATPAANRSYSPSNTAYRIKLFALSPSADEAHIYYEKSNMDVNTPVGTDYLLVKLSFFQSGAPVSSSGLMVYPISIQKVSDVDFFDGEVVGSSLIDNGQTTIHEDTAYTTTETFDIPSVVSGGQTIPARSEEKTVYSYDGLHADVLYDTITRKLWISLVALGYDASGQIDWVKKRVQKDTIFYSDTTVTQRTEINYLYEVVVIPTSNGMFADALLTTETSTYLSKEFLRSTKTGTELTYTFSNKSGTVLYEQTAGDTSTYTNDGVERIDDDNKIVTTYNYVISDSTLRMSYVTNYDYHYRNHYTTEYITSWVVTNSGESVHRIWNYHSVEQPELLASDVYKGFYYFRLSIEREYEHITKGVLSDVRVKQQRSYDWFWGSSNTQTLETSAVPLGPLVPQETTNLAGGINLKVMTWATSYEVKLPHPPSISSSAYSGTNPVGFGPHVRSTFAKAPMYDFGDCTFDGKEILVANAENQTLMKSLFYFTKGGDRVEIPLTSTWLSLPSIRNLAKYENDKQLAASGIFIPR